MSTNLCFVVLALSSSIAPIGSPAIGAPMGDIKWREPEPIKRELKELLPLGSACDRFDLACKVQHPADTINQDIKDGREALKKAGEILGEGRRSGGGQTGGGMRADTEDSSSQEDGSKKILQEALRPTQYKWRPRPDGPVLQRRTPDAEGCGMNCPSPIHPSGRPVREPRIEEGEGTVETEVPD